MGFVTAEEVTLPTRFITKTAHLLAVITIMFDIDVVVNNSIGEATSTFDGDKKLVQSLLWTAIACFVLEYIGLFLGASMFSRLLNSSYIALHFVGTILTTLFYVQGWTASSLAPMVACFNCIPGCLEGLALLLLSRR